MSRKIAISTDSNCGITQSQAKELGVYVVPTPFFIGGELYLEDITLNRTSFFEKLEEDVEISTSMPAPGDLLESWDKLLEEYDEVVHIPLSSGLSSACNTAAMLAQDYEGRVVVVNNQRISVTQKSSVMDALHLIEAGKTAAEIKEILETEKLEASIYITVDTLKYLKKGGRVTPTAAAIGSVLNIKPVLQIQGEKLDSFSKVRGWKAAKKTMIEAAKKDLEERFPGKNMAIYAVASSDCDLDGWVEEVQEAFPEYKVDKDTLSLSVSCHIGPGALAIALAKIVD